MTEPVDHYTLAQMEMDSTRMTASTAVIQIMMARAQVNAILAVADAIERLIRSNYGHYDASEGHTP